MSETASGGRARRVLVVEDGVDAAEALVDLVRLWGHEAWVAHDGPQALDRFREHRPNVVLLDIGLPGKDGYQVATELRGEEGGAEAVLVALTGYGRQEDIDRAHEHGFDHHLLKPIDPGALREMLAQPSD